MVPHSPPIRFVKQDPDRADFTDPRLPRLLDWWRGACGDAAFPAARAIDPLALRFILGWLMIIEPRDGGADFRYRLYGSNIVDVMGRDLTGFNIRDTFPEVKAFFLETYRTALHHRRPILTRHTPPRIVIVAEWERLILPFAGASGEVGQLLVGAIALGRRDVAPTRLRWPFRSPDEA
jgi:hypothetical protein